MRPAIRAALAKASQSQEPAVAIAGRVKRNGDFVAVTVSARHVKVLFITGYAESAAVGNGQMEQGMEVMTKPFVVHELAAKVHGMISD